MSSTAEVIIQNNSFFKITTKVTHDYWIVRDGVELDNYDILPQSKKEIKVTAKTHHHGEISFELIIDKIAIGKVVTNSIKDPQHNNSKWVSYNKAEDINVTVSGNRYSPDNNNLRSIKLKIEQTPIKLNTKKHDIYWVKTLSKNNKTKSKLDFKHEKKIGFEHSNENIESKETSDSNSYVTTSGGVLKISDLSLNLSHTNSKNHEEKNKTQKVDKKLYSVSTIETKEYTLEPKQSICIYQAVARILGSDLYLDVEEYREEGQGEPEHLPFDSYTINAELWRTTLVVPKEVHSKDLELTQ